MRKTGASISSSPPRGRRRQSKRAPPPFAFVADLLAHLDPEVRPMFGCFGIWIGGRIVAALRHRDSHRSVNGVWVATRREHHESLRKQMPSMRSISILGRGVTNWQVIPERAPDFESSAAALCELIARGDPRIGGKPRRRRTR